MRPSPIYVPSTANYIESGASRQIVLLHVSRLGLTLDQAFEPGAFDAKQVALSVGDLIRVNATDGRCWAEVVGVTDNGRLVIEPDTAVARPAAAPARATTRRAA